MSTARNVVLRVHIDVSPAIASLEQMLEAVRALKAEFPEYEPEPEVLDSETPPTSVCNCVYPDDADPEWIASIEAKCPVHGKAVE